MQYSLGMGGTLTQDTAFNGEYGFRTLRYPEAGGFGPDSLGREVYHARAERVEDSAAGVQDGRDNVALRSRCWTETILQADRESPFLYTELPRLDFALPEGNYTVSLAFANPTKRPYVAEVQAQEIVRGRAVVEPGAVESLAFTACVVEGGLRLKLYEASTAATDTSPGQAKWKEITLCGLTIEREEEKQPGEKPTIYLASDSTVQYYVDDDRPQEGWGQRLADFFGGFLEEYPSAADYPQAHTVVTENAVIDNRALGGRSARSFVAEGRLEQILTAIRPGDYMLIQFGHNDASHVIAYRYIDPADFARWLNLYIDGALQRGATPVLVTPVARYNYDSAKGEFIEDFAAYRAVMQEIHIQRGIPLLHLTASSLALLAEYGPEGAKGVFLDNTHTACHGARQFAKCVADMLRAGHAGEYTFYSTEYAPAMERLGARVEYKTADALPGAAPALRLGKTGASSVALCWDGAEEAELYYIYRGDDAQHYSVSFTNEYTDTGCAEGTRYVYRVRAWNEKGFGPFSNRVTVQTKATALYVTTDGAARPEVLYTPETGIGWLGKQPTSGPNGLVQAGGCTLAVDVEPADYEITVLAGDEKGGTTTKSSFFVNGAPVGTLIARGEVAALHALVPVADGKLRLQVGENDQGILNGLAATPVIGIPTGLEAYEIAKAGTNIEFRLRFNTLPDIHHYSLYLKRGGGAFEKEREISPRDAANALSGALYFTLPAGQKYALCLTAVNVQGVESSPGNRVEVDLS